MLKRTKQVVNIQESVNGENNISLIYGPHRAVGTCANRVYRKFMFGGKNDTKASSRKQVYSKYLIENKN